MSSWYQVLVPGTGTWYHFEAMNIQCPCHSHQNYSECCEPFISGQRLPDMPEQLMRSRYTAFTQANMDYIQHTMSGGATRDNDIESTRQWAKAVEWLGLEVLHTEIDPDKSSKGLVEFKASYRLNNKNQVLHERSLFEKIGDRWFYVGQAPHQNTLKIGRNDPCICGSGKKYKKCCLS